MTSVAGTTSIGRSRVLVPRQLALYLGRLSHQQDADTQFARRQDRTLDFRPGSVIASHSVNSDSNHGSLPASRVRPLEVELNSSKVCDVPARTTTRRWYRSLPAPYRTHSEDRRGGAAWFRGSSDTC